MKLQLLITTLALAAVSLALGQEARIGGDAPLFTLNDADGKSHNLADYKGKFVVLEWFNEGCPFVKKHYTSGHMQKLQQEYADKNVVWFSISSSAPGKEGHMTSEQAQHTAAEWKMDSTKILLDQDAKVARMYAAKSTPHLFVIDPQGKLIYHGAIDNKPTGNTADLANAQNYVKLALDSAMGGKPVATAITRPYGCALKY